MISAPSEVLTVFPRSFALIITYPSIKRRIFSALLGLLLTLSPAVNAGPKALTIVVFGDSISAAYGIQTDQGWVSLLSDRLKNQYPHYTVVNASVSGETTGGGLTRLPKTLAIHQPDILILELGGNDGLRGYPIERITGNLSKMISEAQSAGSTVLLIGMVLPPNYGHRYTQSFERLFQTLADKYSLPFVPFLLEGTSTDKTLIQRDGIHPTAEAQPKLLDDIWQGLEPLLRRVF